MAGVAVPDRQPGRLAAVTQELTAVLADYRAGLDAALSVLAQLEDLSTRQQREAASAEATSPERMQAFIDERQHLLDGLLLLETRLAPLRDHISNNLDAARAVPGFQVVAERHRSAGAAVARIMQTDQQSVEALRQADALRRADAQSVETAGVTLAAYRRVLAGPQGSAGLVDQRG